MLISILPKSPLGRWSVGLAAACILLLVLLVVLDGRDGVVKSGGLGANMLGGGSVISSLASFIIGLISIIKSRERSILVFVVVVVMCLFCSLFLVLFIGEG